MTTFDMEDPEESYLPSRPLYRALVPSSFGVAIAALVVGIFFDVALRQTRAGLALALACLAAPIAMLVLGRIENRFARAITASGVIFAALLVARDDVVLTMLNTLTAIATLVLGAILSRDRSLFRISILGVIIKANALFPQAIGVFRYVIKPFAAASGKKGRLKSIIIGVFVAIPIVIVFGTLLASADPVFASLFSFHSSILTHLIIVLIIAWLFSTLVFAASCELFDGTPQVNRRLGSTEAITTLSLVALLFAIFAVSQVVVWSGGAKHILETAGLTYAEHARRGFSQLIAVGAMTIGVVLGLGALRREGSTVQNRVWKVVSLLTVALTMVIVAVAISRLALYENAYGLTIDRFYATAIAYGLGVVFLLLAINIFKGFDGGTWFVSGVVITALVFLLGLNIVGPERTVANRNLDRNHKTAVPLDFSYLSSLGLDGIGVVVNRLDELDKEQQQRFLDDMCGSDRSVENDNLLTFNISRSQMKDDLRRACVGTRPKKPLM